MPPCWQLGSTNISGANGGRDVEKTPPPSEVVPEVPEQIQALMKKAANGDKSTLPVLRELMKSPEAVDLLGGDLARETQLKLIDKLSGKNLLLKESIGKKLETMKAEIEGAQPTPIERLLVERITVCWLHVYYLEQRYSENECLRLDIGAYYERCLDHAHKRYLAAIRALAMVRKMALPALQLNIGQNQFNVAGGSTDE